jgi:hypothetical protein
MVGMFVCLCLTSKKPSEREFFVPAGTDLGVKLLIENMIQPYCYCRDTLHEDASEMCNFRMQNKKGMSADLHPFISRYYHHAVTDFSIFVYPHEH